MTISLGEFKGTLLTLFIAVFFLLLVSCGNVAILLLALGSARQYELAMRSALGATRLRILRQLLTEAVCLSLAGGLLGVGIAFAAVRLIIKLMPEYAIPHEVQISLSLPVLLFCLAICGCYRACCRPVACVEVVLKSVRRTDYRWVGVGLRSFQGTNAQNAMILIQIALTVLLLAGSGAAIQSLLGIIPRQTRIRSSQRTSAFPWCSRTWV